ncbi:MULTISPECIES: DUF3558 family protein [Amycolatopsis]|uniref:DUF3558 domain-containing protein n=1 Tax=Amycolatopsis bullii TaxID=941987 RepID=A0ABQ3KNR2_9PSEU|nr:DUF3558 family protein [Amycolatopsis bullii]GHG41063.1 hypothetical protein GCM10017567_73140 [Amycolatopsis bullii]
MRDVRTETRPSFRHRTALAGFVLLALSGCGSEIAGNPRAVDTPSGSTPATPPPRTGNDPFTQLNPCKLLDQALTGRGYSAAKRSDVDAAHNCDAKKTDYGTIGLALQPGQTINQTIADPGKAVAGDVNGRPAVQEREALGGTGSCDISMEVAPNSRATVLVTLQTAGTDEACRLANDVSTKVELLLPK